MINKTLRYIVLAGIFLVPFIPLIVSNSLFFPFISGKNFAFRIIVEIVFGAWLILSLRDPSARPKWSSVLTSIMVFAGIILLADIFSKYSYKSFWSNFERMEGFVGLIHLVAFGTVLASFFKSEKLWNRLFHVSLGVSIFLSFFAIVQVAGELAINQGGLRVDATLGNAIYLAVYLMFHVFIAALLWLRREAEYAKNFAWSILVGSAIYVVYFFTHFGGRISGYHAASISLFVVSILGLAGAGYLLFAAYRDTAFSRYIRTGFYAAAILLELAMIYYTATRGVLLGLVGAFILLGLLFSIFGKGYKALRWAGVSVLVVCILVVGAFFMLRNNQTVRQNPILGRVVSINLTDADAHARFAIWKMAWQGFKERPILGWGQESFNYVFNKYYDPSLYLREQWFDRTHSIIFDWLIAGGILGLLAYLAIFVVTLLRIWKRRTPNGDIPNNASNSNADSSGFTFVEKSLLTALLAAYFFQNIFVFDNLTSYFMFFLILAYVHFRTQGPAAPVNRPAAVSVSNDRIVNTVYAPIVIAAVAFLVYFVNVRPMLAGSALIDAMNQQQGGITQNLDLFKKAISYNTFANPEIREQLAQITSSVIGSDSVDAATKQAFFDFTKSELEKQVMLTPDDARYEVFFGSFLDRTGQYADAIPYLEKAVALSPKKQTMLYELGSDYLNAGQPDKALAQFKTAYEAYPQNDEARAIYALGAIYANKLDLADSILKDATTAVLTDSRLIQAYLATKQNAKAVALARRLVDMDPNNTEYHMNLAAVLYQTGNSSAAIAEVRKVIQLNPSFKDQGEAIIKDIQSGKK